MDIIKMAAAKGRTHKEISELFNVRCTTVAALTSALKRGKSTVIKRRTKELSRANKHAAIVKVVSRLIA